MINAKVGDIISFPFGVLGSLKHVGVCTGFHPATGEPLIAHNSSRFGGVSIHPMSKFSEGNKVQVRSSKSTRSPQSIQAAAHRLMNKRYSALDYNCEHFVNDVLGFKVKSPQLAFWGGILILGGVACICASRR